MRMPCIVRRGVHDTARDPVARVPARLAQPGHGDCSPTPPSARCRRGSSAVRTLPAIGPMRRPRSASCGRAAVARGEVEQATRLRREPGLHLHTHRSARAATKSDTVLL